MSTILPASFENIITKLGKLGINDSTACNATIFDEVFSSLTAWNTAVKQFKVSTSWALSEKFVNEASKE